MRSHSAAASMLISSAIAALLCSAASLMVPTAAAEVIWIDEPATGPFPATLQPLYGNVPQNITASGDTYDTVPWLRKNAPGPTTIANASGAPIVPTVDGTAATGGNPFGSGSGSRFACTSMEVPIDADTVEITAEIAAIDGAGNLEPWVDISFSGQGWFVWGMTVATSLGATDRILPNTPFVIDDVRVVAFDSAGSTLFEAPIPEPSEQSDATGLAAGIGLAFGHVPDIAGFDNAVYQFRWTITEVPEPGSGLLIGLAALGLLRRR